jgi:hypothetical protein
VRDLEFAEPHAFKNLYYYKINDINRHLESAQEMADEFSSQKLNPTNALEMEKILQGLIKKQGTSRFMH